MKNNRSRYIKNLMLPCLGYSALTGAATACLVFVFKWLADRAFDLSLWGYSFVREQPIWLPCLLLLTVAIGILAALLLKWAPDCRGGGIPTVVAALRGLLPFRWLKSVLVLPLSALLTFLCGVPLGNEGPCVQMGAALGEGAVTLTGKKNAAWRRYIMTGGACAGFAVATGAPLAGIFFAFEEAHRRLSPMIFMSSSVSVISAQWVMLMLCELTGTSNAMFHFGVLPALPLSKLWIALPVGVVCGVCAIFFSKAYKALGRLIHDKLARVPFWVRVAGVFLLSGICGAFGVYFVSSGHMLIEQAVLGEVGLAVLIVSFAVRGILLMLANNIGVTGGLFIPTLAFGAIIGSVCSEVLTLAGVLGAEYYAVPVIVGMAAFLGASSRIPLTACVFAFEVLCGRGNIFPVTVAVAVALLIIETVGETVFSDAVIENKLESRHKGKTARIFDVFLTVKPEAFVVEKEIRDILWPNTCTVLSVEKAEGAPSVVGLSKGDVLHVHYQSYEPEETFSELEALVGRQDDDVRMRVRLAGEHHTVPDVN